METPEQVTGGSSLQGSGFKSVKNLLLCTCLAGRLTFVMTGIDIKCVNYSSLTIFDFHILTNIHNTIYNYCAFTFMNI